MRVASTASGCCELIIASMRQLKKSGVSSVESFKNQTRLELNSREVAIWNPPETLASMRVAEGFAGPTASPTARSRWAVSRWCSKACRPIPMQAASGRWSRTTRSRSSALRSLGSVGESAPSLVHLTRRRSGSGRPARHGISGEATCTTVVLERSRPTGTKPRRWTCNCSTGSSKSSAQSPSQRTFTAVATCSRRAAAE